MIRFKLPLHARFDETCWEMTGGRKRINSRALWLNIIPHLSDMTYTFGDVRENR